MSLLNSYQNKETMKSTPEGEVYSGDKSTEHTEHTEHTEPHLSTKDKIKEKIHKVKDKLRGKDHSTECAGEHVPAHAEAPLSNEMDIGKARDSELRVDRPVLATESADRPRPGQGHHVDKTGMEYCDDLGCHALSPCTRHPVLPKHHHHGNEQAIAETQPAQGSHVDSEGLEYCNDVRCHNVGPCTKHPVLPKHHHHVEDSKEGKLAGLTLVEERLAINRVPVEEGAVDIHKHVTTQQVNEPVAVRREDVVIERRPIENPEEYKPTVTEDLITIPLYEEEITVEKRLVPKEEIIVRKREVLDTKTVTATLRSEVAEVTRLPQGTGFPQDSLNLEGMRLEEKPKGEVTFKENYVDERAKAAATNPDTRAYDSRDNGGHSAHNEKITEKYHAGHQQVK